MALDLSIDPRSLLAHMCTNEPLLTSTGKEPLRHVPFQRWDTTTGTRIPTTALLASVDNGNDAFKGAMIHASTPYLRTRRIVTAYAPAKTLRAGEGLVTWQVNDSEPFWIGNNALQGTKTESLPIGMTEDRLFDERFRRYLFACLVELLLEAGYGQYAHETLAHHDLYLSLGVPNEEITRKGIKESTGRVLQSIFNTAFTIHRTDEQGQVTNWQLRIVEFNPYPQSFASFVTWYYTIEGLPIETEMIKHVTVDIGGGQLHSCEVTLQRQSGGKPRLYMSATQLDEGTISIARALSERLRSLYQGVRLSDVEAQQALISGYASIGGRYTPIGSIVSQVVTARSANLLNAMRKILQEDQSYLMFTGGGSILLAQSLQEIVRTRQRAAHTLFVPKGLAPVLNAIGGYLLAQTAAKRVVERAATSVIAERATHE